MECYKCEICGRGVNGIDELFPIYNPQDNSEILAVCEDCRSVNEGEHVG